MSAITHANIEALEQHALDLDRVGEKVRAGQIRIAATEIRELRKIVFPYHHPYPLTSFRKGDWCPNCGGEGWVPSTPDGPCPACKGSGKR